MSAVRAATAREPVQGAVAWRPAVDGLWRPVVVPTAGRLLLLGQGPRGELLRAFGDGDSWEQPVSIGVPVGISSDTGVPSPVGWPLAACVDDDDLHLFATGPDGELLHAHEAGEGLLTFENLGAPATPLPPDGTLLPVGLATAPAACVTPEGVEVFVAGREGDLLHTRSRGSGWSGFMSLGAPSVRRGEQQVAVPLSVRVTVCPVGVDRLIVLARGAHGNLVCKVRDTEGWSDFVSLGFPKSPNALYPAAAVAAPLTSEPAACSWDRDRVDVVVRGPGGEVLHRYWDGAGSQDWSPFTSLGTPTSADGAERLPCTGDVTVCSLRPGRLDVLARALDGRIYHAVWDDGWVTS